MTTCLKTFSGQNQQFVGHIKNVHTLLLCGQTSKYKSFVRSLDLSQEVSSLISVSTGWFSKYDGVWVKTTTSL